MSAWETYVDLLDELAGQPAQEASERAAAEERFQQDRRRAQNAYASLEKEFGQVRDRNSRLQAGIRTVTRELRVPPLAALPDEPMLEGRQLAEALTAAEYDLQQLRRSLDYAATQRTLEAQQLASSQQRPSTALTSAKPQQPPGNRHRAVIALSVGALVVLAIANALFVVSR